MESFELDGVGDIHSLWGCNSGFHCNYFSINNYHKLVEVGAPGSCGAVALACIAIAVPHPPRQDPNIWRGSQVFQVLQLLCLLRSRLKYISAYCRGCVFNTVYGGGAPIPSYNCEVVTSTCIATTLGVVAIVLSTTSMCKGGTIQRGQTS